MVSHGGRLALACYRIWQERRISLVTEHVPIPHSHPRNTGNDMSMKRMFGSSETVTPVPQRMQREPPKPFCATDEEAKEWAAKWWQEFSATDWRGGKAAEGRLYQDSVKLFALMEPATDDGLAPVKLVRGSWLLKRARKLRHASTEEERAKLRVPRRQELERVFCKIEPNDKSRY